MAEDFPCFACGSTGPHGRIPLTRAPGMTDEAWEQRRDTPLILWCETCAMQTWEPDAGDGLQEPNLTMIRPGLRNIARQALDERDFPKFLILAEGHHRGLLAEDNVLYFRQRALWDDVILAQLRLEQPD